MPTLPRGTSVSLDHLRHLYDSLQTVVSYWQDHKKVIDGALVSILYDRVIAKSRRVHAFFKDGSRQTSNQSIVGARFSRGETPKHIITHYIKMDLLNDSVNELGECIQVMQKDFFQGILMKMSEK